MRTHSARRMGILLIVLLLLLSGCGEGTDPHATASSSAPVTAGPAGGAEAGRPAMSDGEVDVETAEELPPPENIAVHLCALGDIMAHDGTYLAAKQSDGSYDFTAMLEEIAPYVSGADFSFGNLETTFSGKARGYSGYPTFNTPESLAHSLKDLLGLDLVSTANNHTLDKGYTGLVSTLDFLDSYGIGHTGSFRSAEEAAGICMQTIRGVKIAFLSYTYGSNTAVPSSRPYCLNVIDQKNLQNAAKKARGAGADYVIALLHWGVEYKRAPSDEQKSLARWLFENTEIDMIVGNHPHVTEPIEEIEVTRDGAVKKGVVFYALGNFTGAQRREYTDTGIIADIYLSISPGDPAKNRVERITYTPTYIDPNPQGNPKRYRVVSLLRAVADYESGADPLISKADYQTLLQYRSDYQKLLQTLPLVSERTDTPR